MPSPAAPVSPVPLTTCGLAADEQAEIWGRTLASSLHPVHARPVVPTRPIEADFQVLAARGSGLTRGTVDPLRMTIRPADAAQAPADRVFLTVHHGAHRRVSTDRAKVDVAPGELFAYFGDEPCRHVTGARDESLLLAVPVEAMTLDPVGLRRLSMRSLPLPASARAVLVAAADHVLAPGSGLAETAVERYLVGVAELVLRTVTGAEVDHAGTVPVRRQQALDVMAARLGDPDLDPDAVAAALHVSRRRLYQLFADTPSVAATIRRLRVERAVRELTAPAGDPSAPPRSVGQVARACGFRSVSHFSRVVLAETGRRPSEFTDGIAPDAASSPRDAASAALGQEQPT